MIIAIDFDGTCVTHNYPMLGRDIGAVPTLLALVEEGHQLILWTMRSGEQLKEALDWFEQHGIELFSCNENPEQQRWTSSPKAYAELYIDDAALGAPLIVPVGDSSYINWPEVRALLVIEGILSK